MALASLSTMAYIFKRVYAKNQAIELVAYKNHPFLALVKKTYNVGGNTYEVPVQYSLGGGLSNTFSSAQTNTSGADGVVFSCTRKKLFALEQIDNEAVAAAKTDEGAFARLVTQRTNDMIEKCMTLASLQAFRSGTGSIGRRASISTNTITLTNGYDAHNWLRGYNLVASASDGGALRTGSSAVTAVVRPTIGATTATGTVTVASAAAISSFSDNDFLYIDGTAQNNGTQKALSGLQGWVPTTVSATAFQGVDRTSDANMLAGSRLDATGMNHLEAVVGMGNQIAAFGGKPDIAVMHPKDFDIMVKLLADQIRYVDVATKVAGVSFRGIEVAYANGSLKVVTDPHCPAGSAFVLSTDTWELICAGPVFPNIWTEAGDPAITVHNDDAIELRSNNYVELVCRRPVMNGVVFNLGA